MPNPGCIMFPAGVKWWFSVSPVVIKRELACNDNGSAWVQRCIAGKRIVNTTHSHKHGSTTPHRLLFQELFIVASRPLFLKDDTGLFRYPGCGYSNVCWDSIKWIQQCLVGFHWLDKAMFGRILLIGYGNICWDSIKLIQQCLVGFHWLDRALCSEMPLIRYGNLFRDSIDWIR